ncbi:unnamed protein product [Brassica oleracea var. botrytis]
MILIVFGEMKTKANKKSVKSDSVRKILKEKQKTKVEETSPTRTSPRLCLWHMEISHGQLLYISEKTSE